MRAVPLMNCHRPTSPSTSAGLGRCSSAQGLPSQGSHVTAGRLNGSPPPPGGRLQPVLMRHPPSYLSKLGGGVDLGGGGRLGGSRGGISAGGGGVPKVGGLARDPLLPHAYLLGGCVSGVGGYGGMYAIIALSRPCREESLKGRRVAPRPAPPPPSPSPLPSPLLFPRAPRLVCEKNS